LINPETAEFFDFEQISLDDFADEIIRAGAVVTNGRYDRDGFRNKVREQAKSLAPESRFYKLRVRADGKLGNHITSQMLCVGSDIACECSDAEQRLRNNG